jgi:hypothetical protein
MGREHGSGFLMRTSRIAFAVPGLAALVWGLVLAVQFALHSFRDGRSAVAFFIAGPILHDALVAPFVGLVGLVISRLVGQHWRTPVRLGAAVSGVLTLLAVPAIWRTYAGQPNPGLDDRNYTAGLLIALAVVWLAVVAWGLLRQRRHRPPKPPPPKPQVTERAGGLPANPQVASGEVGDLPRRPGGGA